MSTIALGLWIVSQLAGQSGLLEWNSDYAAALAESRREQRPLVVVLEDRHQARGMSRLLDRPYAYVAFRDCTVCRLDVSSSQGAELAHELQATVFPYTMVSDPSGRRIVFRVAGEFTERMWLQLLSDALPHPISMSPVVMIDRWPFKVGATSTTARKWRARQKAASKRLRVVVLSTNGCAYCEKLKIESLPDPAVARAMGDDMKLEYVNASEDESLSAQHGVAIYPTILVLDERSRLLDRIDGFVEPGRLAQRLAFCRRR